MLMRSHSNPKGPKVDGGLMLLMKSVMRGAIGAISQIKITIPTSGGRKPQARHQ
ncbi:hypothetical protein [Leptolyngbya sp. Heron Island J]|uniref:hypothetical protein n=1 Tax=Leptolyngbya sp. Heron Island J TaxID=1385935 RepID=UPI000419A2BF|nr:hypothetical protein [Leptolyngbya sp. Heron Island J]